MRRGINSPAHLGVVAKIIAGEKSLTDLLRMMQDVSLYPRTNFRTRQRHF
jgi:hypothetical protein